MDYLTEVLQLAVQGAIAGAVIAFVTPFLSPIYEKLLVRTIKRNSKKYKQLLINLITDRQLKQSLTDLFSDPKVKQQISDFLYDIITNEKNIERAKKVFSAYIDSFIQERPLLRMILQKAQQKPPENERLD